METHTETSMTKEDKKMKAFLRSKIFTRILYCIGALLVVLLIFQAGVSIGYRKAAFSFQLGENYYKTFGESRGPHLPGLEKDDFPSAHGVVGKIIKIALPEVFVAALDGTERAILIDDDTSVRRLRDTVSPADIKVGDSVIVFGTPNDNSVLDATLIRVMSPVHATTTESRLY